MLETKKTYLDMPQKWKKQLRKLNYPEETQYQKEIKMNSKLLKEVLDKERSKHEELSTVSQAKSKSRKKITN